MNQGNSKFFHNIASLSNWIIILGIAWILGTIGLGWVINSLLIVIALLLLTPTIAFFVLRWWLNRNLISAPCPVCNYEFTAFQKTECQCPNCGEVLQVENGKFERLTPPGTIDVTAVDVSVSQLSSFDD